MQPRKLSFYGEEGRYTETPPVFVWGGAALSVYNTYDAPLFFCSHAFAWNMEKRSFQHETLLHLPPEHLLKQNSFSPNQIVGTSRSLPFKLFGFCGNFTSTLKVRCVI